VDPAAASLSLSDKKIGPLNLQKVDRSQWLNAEQQPAHQHLLIVTPTVETVICDEMVDLIFIFRW
jgi:hypothetical protein